ncbi:Homeobox-leucine zipper protein HOX28 [Triticum urartu]|uniref:Homeobox-leucine zipper protein HOX28 n=1 Tax=Triticum urartu TaxID=4572 RepID=M8A5B7_TRIUA|nr:Homeobox-leucine zipper protein HOX28 [Triticum urartu]
MSPSTSPKSGISAGTKRGLEHTSSGVFPAASSDEDDGGGDGAGGRKNLRMSKDQSAVLEECFKTHSALNPKQNTALANRLGLRPRQVENKRLEKEVAELRVLKAAPQAHNGASEGPLTTLTMSLSRKRVASTSSASAGTVPSFSANAGTGMPMPSLKEWQFFCAFRDTGAMYGGSSRLAKVVKPAR